ncbi:MAG: hypothetical protein ACRCXH_06955 [Shewanella sp.]
MPQKVEFIADYDHEWLLEGGTIAVSFTRFPAGTKMTVKDEVAAGALAAGALSVSKLSEPVDIKDGG